MTTFALRPERSEDVAAIREVVQAAFGSITFSSHTEHLVVDALRAADALTVSLVAAQHATVVGHVAISPITITDGTADWFGLGPVAVAPSHQRRGIGSALVRAALEQLRNRRAAGCVVFGHADYYPRFGFRREPQLVLPGLRQEHFFALHWRGTLPAGDVAYHAAFGATG